MFGRAQKAQALASASAPPPAQLQAASPAVHNGVTWNAPAAAPKISLVQQQGATPSNPFGGSNPYIDFQLPRTVGKMTDCDAEFTLTFTTTDPSGCDVVVAPSSFFVQKVDVLYNGNSVEPVDADVIHQEAILWRDSDSLAANASRWNIQSSGALAPSFNVTPSAPVTSTWYLPLGRGNFLSGLQPYLKGFEGVWTFRLYFASSIVVSCYTTGTRTASACSVALPKIQLYVTEAVLSAAAEASLAQSHQSATLYKTVVRTKVTGQSFASMSNAGASQVQLAGFSENESAALITYLQSNNPTIPQMMAHNEIATWQLKDERGNEITIPLPEAVYLKSASLQVPQNLAVIANPTYNVLHSFSSNVNSVLETGKYAAHRKLTGRETVFIQPAAALSNVTPIFVSFDYAVLSVAGGKPSLQRKATA